MKAWVTISASFNGKHDLIFAMFLSFSENINLRCRTYKKEAEYLTFLEHLPADYRLWFAVSQAHQCDIGTFVHHQTVWEVDNFWRDWKRRNRYRYFMLLFQPETRMKLQSNTLKIKHPLRFFRERLVFPSTRVSCTYAKWTLHDFQNLRIAVLHILHISTAICCSVDVAVYTLHRAITD